MTNEKTSQAEGVKVRLLDLEMDHATVVPLWQNGFHELAPFIHIHLKQDALVHSGLAFFFGLSAYFRSKIGMGFFGAFAFFLHSPLAGWALKKLLWKGIMAETKRDMTADKIREKYLREGESTFLVAEHEGRVVGCVAVLKKHTLYREAKVKPEKGGVDATGEASVWRLSVDPSVRKLGLGRTLMQAAEQWAVKNGCHHLTLLTGNHQSQKFYHRLGYGAETVERAYKVIFNRPLDSGTHGKPVGFGEIVKAYFLRKRLCDRQTILMKQLVNNKKAQ